jgi:NADH-quinone oxidoreductase subunit L
MYHAIVFLPLIGFLIAGMFGRVIGPRPSEIVTTSLLGVSAFLSWIAFVSVGFGSGATRVQVATWMVSGDLVVDWAFRIDTLTAVMLVVVTTVSTRSATCTRIRTGRGSSPTCRCSPSPC